MTKVKSELDELETYYIQHYPREFAAAAQNNPKFCFDSIKRQATDDIVKIIELLPPAIGMQVVMYFSHSRQLKIFQQLNTKVAIDIVRLMDSDTVAQLTAQLPASLAEIFHEAIGYPSDSAGYLMERNIPRFSCDLTVKEATSLLKKAKNQNYRVLFITDNNNKLSAYVTVQDLLFASDQKTLNELKKTLVCFVNDTDSKDVVLEQMEKYKITDCPVIDLDGNLLGIIKYRTMFNSVREAAMENIQSMVGASPDEKALSSVSTVVTKRLPWLQINLLTAFLAAFVVGIFESTIEKYTALAILLPIVAGQSGNTGAQALAVTMRGLALKEVYSYQWKRIIFKEAFSALINGLVVALTTAVCVYLWSRSTGLSVIIFSSMVIAMVLAAIAGALTPIMLNRFGLDPAQSSSIILTTITDVTGFFCFLGIATALIATLPT